MPLLLTGYTMTERTIIPAISKAIDGCIRNNELELADLLAGIKTTLNDFLRSHDETPRPKAQKYESKARLKEVIRERNIGISEGIIESITDSYWAKGVTASQYAALPLNANVAQSADIEASTLHVPTIDSSINHLPADDTIPDEAYEEGPIDTELYDMATAIREKYPDMEEHEALKQAAHNVEYKIPLDKV